MPKSPAQKRSEKATKAKVKAEAVVKKILRDPLVGVGETIKAGVKRFNARQAAKTAKGVANVSRGIRERARKRKLLSGNPTN